MVIELYSIPGAGKTTIIKSLIHGAATSYSGKRGARRFVIQTAKKIAVYMPESLKYKKQMKEAVFNYQCRRPLFYNRSFNQHLNNIVLVSWAYKHSSKPVYMDEGLVHRLIALAVNYDLSDDELIRLVDIFRGIIAKANCFYLDVSVQVCMDGIKKRNRHMCEMDDLSDEKLIDFLKRYEHFCITVRDHFNHPTVTRENYEIMRRKK